MNSVNANTNLQSELYILHSELSLDSSAICLPSKASDNRSLGEGCSAMEGTLPLIPPEQIMPLPLKPDKIYPHTDDKRKRIAHDTSDKQRHSATIQLNPAYTKYDHLYDPGQEYGQDRRPCRIEGNQRIPDRMNRPPRKPKLAERHKPHPHSHPHAAS